jgi:hypothetical protein
MPEAAISPFINFADYLRAYRILSHVYEGFNEFPHAVNDLREKPLSPHMPADEMLPVPCHGEHAQYPLHNTRQGLALFRTYYQMNVVAHDAEIMDLETELFFCPHYCVEKEGSHGIAMEDHFLSVCPCGNVVRCAGLQYSISPHTAYMEASGKML